MAAEAFEFDLTWNTSDANFRFWISSIHAILNAGGWVQTADTGQVDPGTVTNPLANSIAGYSVWRSNDVEGDLVEFYLRLEFWGLSTGRVGLKVQLGYGTDGAGNITGVRTDLYNLTSGSSWFTPTSYLSAGPGYLLLLFSSSTSQFNFSIERIRDNSGQPTDDLLVFTWQFNFSMSRSVQVLTPNRAFAASSSFFNATPGSVNSVIDGVVGVGLTFGQKAGLTNPSVNILISPERSNTVPSAGQVGGTVQIRTYGTLRKYLIWPGNVNGYNFGGSSNIGNYTLFE